MQLAPITAVGRVVGGRTEVEDDNWGSVCAHIELHDEILEKTATRGLEAFSHVEVVFVFDQVVEDSICRGDRHPRGRRDWPSVGILAQRAKDRPNRIGITTCELVDVGPGWLEVRGLDAVVGTPVLDIKPFMREFGPRGPVVQPQWASELMKGYW
jgi:tRNA-Thr(GGU) m(6)t(6)A37 methyltransferase TsaA